MPTLLNDVLPMTSDLELADRAKLAEYLLLSLEEPNAKELESLWLSEAKRRLEGYRSGESLAIPADEVFRRALADLS
jgi:putative addiction module component (TIGR02574 family)